MACAVRLASSHHFFRIAQLSMPLAFRHPILAIKRLLSRKERPKVVQQSQVSRGDANAPIYELQPQFPTRGDINAPISRLPDEILLDIFMIVVDRDRLRRPFFITYVCRHWWAVAVGAPLLWAKLRIDDYHRVKLMLERSDPVDLDVGLNSWMSLRTIEALIDSMSRVASLQVEQGGRLQITTWDSLGQRWVHDGGLPPQLVHIILNRPTPPARRLTSLTVKCWEMDEPFLDVTALLQHLPQHGGQLRYLKLAYTHVDWSIFPLRSLTHLHLHNTTISSRVPIQAFITILGQMPLLESLSLDLSSVVDADAVIPLQASKTSLPALWWLDLRGCTVDLILYFLTHTALPRLRDIFLSLKIQFISGQRPGNDSYLPLMRALATTVMSGDFGIFDHLSYHSNVFHLSAGDAPDTSSKIRHPDSRVQSHFAIHLSRDWYSETEDPSLCAALVEDLMAITGNPIAARITNLQFESSSTPDDFEQLLSLPCCSFVQELAIYTLWSFLPRLTRLLDVTLLQNEDSCTFNVPFPDLRTISVDSDLTLPKFVDTQVWEAMCDCLAMRKSAGFAVEEFALGLCSITPEMYASLAKAVTVCTGDLRRPLSQ